MNGNLEDLLIDLRRGQERLECLKPGSLDLAVQAVEELVVARNAIKVMIEEKQRVQAYYVALQARVKELLKA